MSAQDKAAKARARMDQVRREMSERRALRTRNARAAKDKALDSLMKQGPVAAQVAKHMGELGRRRAAAGGWATEKTERDKDYILGFGGEDEERRDEFAFRPSPPPQADPPPGGLGAIDDEETAPPAPPTPPAPETPAARQVRRPVREVLDDEDDFSSQSSWMRNQ
ncbi:hypothetical protein [Actinophytocola sp.]|jgi:hypothetical protein|uniref:hypothetical protein n=1 Tax=Actinophytocola sp. TaxID=1872138 RepID=UPI002EDA8B15